MKRLYSFTEMFPDFDVPSNKLFMWNASDQLEATKSVSYKGFSVVDNGGSSLGLSPKSGSKTVAYIYDATFNNIAAGLGYANAGEHFQMATDDTVAASIAQNYVGAFNPSFDYNIVNGEFWHTVTDFLKFSRTVQALGTAVHTAYPSLKIGWWNHGRYSPNMFTSTSAELREHYNTPSERDKFFYGFAFRTWDVNQTDGYAMGFGRVNDQLYDIFQSHEVGRKFNDGNKYITTWWEKQEKAPGDIIEIERWIPELASADDVKAFSERPSRTACNAFNGGLLHATCLNGMDLWEAPFHTTSDKRYYLVDDGDRKAHPTNNQTYYKEVANSNLDWLVLGMYFASQPEAKSIIELSDEWVLPNFEFDGNSISGDNRYPSYSRPGQVNASGHPIVRVKYNTDKTKALIVAVYPSNPDPTNNVDIRVTDPNTDLDETVTVTGGWAGMWLVDGLEGVFTGGTGTPDWIAPSGTQCNGTSTEIQLAVSYNDGNTVEFSTDNVNWSPATESKGGFTNNALTVLLPSTGNCESVWYKIPGLSIGSTWGCYLTRVDCIGGGGGTDPDWITPYGSTCNGTSTEIQLAVRNNQGHTVEFSIDNTNWSQATQNVGGFTNNGLTVLLPSTGNCEGVYYRIPGLSVGSTWGCFTTRNDCGGVVPCGTSEANPHDVANSSDGSHHGYYDNQTNQLKGTFFSGNGEYNAYGVWKPAIYLGNGENGKRFVGYKEAFVNATNVHTRTQSGCTEFADARTTEVVTNRYDNKLALDLSPTGTGTLIDFDGIRFSHTLTQANNGYSVFYAITLLNTEIPGLTWRINGSAWNNATVQDGNTELLSTDVIGGIPQDFILDMSTDGGSTFEVFVVRTMTLGGHFSTVQTVTRKRDGAAWVSTFMGDPLVPSFVRIGGVTYNSLPGAGSSHKVPSIASGVHDAVFGFAGVSYDWATIRVKSFHN